MDDRDGRAAAGDAVQGKRIQGSKGHRIQARRIRSCDFTPAKRTVFLNTLAATCNVSASARAAGITPVTVHHLRRTAPDFAALWEEALEIGYHYLEEQLLARAIEGVEALTIDPEAAPVPPLPPLTGPDGARDRDGDGDIAGGTAGGRRGPGPVANRGLPVAYQLALQVLGRRRAATERGTRFGRRKAMTTQEVDALLMEKLDRLDRLDAARAERARLIAQKTAGDAAMADGREASRPDGTEV